MASLFMVPWQMSSQKLLGFTVICFLTQEASVRLPGNKREKQNFENKLMDKPRTNISNIPKFANIYSSVTNNKIKFFCTFRSVAFLETRDECQPHNKTARQTTNNKKQWNNSENEPWVPTSLSFPPALYSHTSPLLRRVIILSSKL